MRFFAVAALLVLTAVVVYPQAGKEKKQAMTTVRGMVDQSGTEFIIGDLKTLEPIATLQTTAFDVQVFARFVGVPVEARGMMETRDGKKILHIQKIDDIKRIPLP